MEEVRAHGRAKGLLRELNLVFNPSMSSNRPDVHTTTLYRYRVLHVGGYSEHIFSWIRYKIRAANFDLVVSCTLSLLSIQNNSCSISR